MTASQARKLTDEHARFTEKFVLAQMGDIFKRIERSAIAGQDVTIVTLPDGLEQGAIKVLRSRGFQVNEFDSGTGKVMVRW